MEPEGSLPHSQEPFIDPYPEPDHSSPHHPILFLHDPFQYYPLIYDFVLVASLSLWLSHQQPICIPLLPHSCYMPCPSHPPSFHHSNCTWQRGWVIKLHIMQRTSFAPIQNHRQNYSLLNSNVYAFRQQTRRQKVLDWMVASVPVTNVKMRNCLGFI
jgi:hypothetical protein